MLPILAAAVFVVPAAALSASSPQVVLRAEPLEAAVVGELNAVRAQYGLRPLRPSLQLATSAGAHSREMVNVGYFAHESADGTPFWRRIRQFYAGRGRGWQVGENLLWQAPSVSARAAVRAWLRSPGHRENVLRPGFREVGVSAVRAAGAPGVFGKRRVVVLTVDFGRR